jgi:hypothetical protein
VVGETATVVRETAAGGFGERSTFADSHAIVGLFAPTGGFEQTGGRDTVTTQPTFYAEPGSDVTSTDRLRVRGVVYQVDGEPALWQLPASGATAGLQVPLRGVAG